MKFALNLLATMILLSWFSSYALANDAALKSYSTQGEFEEVIQDVEDAIVNAGLNIDYRGKIGEMLDRTRKDLGGTTKIYNGAQFMQFCSARLSRRMMEADPANMGVCPYIVYVYKTTKKPGTVVVGYKRPQGAAGEASQKALNAIDTLLNAIVKEATDN
ncbi:MAG: DUF302 domain-containing protein [bacterium]|nr:DUF302 domain-containing protein [bacterium]